MSVGPLAVEITVVCGLVLWFLHRYGNFRKQTIMVTVAAFLSWYFSFLIVVILPLDVSSTVYRQCLYDNAPAVVTTIETTTTPPLNVTTQPSVAASTIEPSAANNTLSGGGDGVVGRNEVEPCAKPWSYIPPSVLPVLWRIIYWSSQVLTWLLLPMMQSYAKAGDFTIMGRIRSALIANAIYYGTYLLIFGVCLIYVAVKPDLHVDGSQLKVLAITASNTWGLFLLVLLLGYGLVEVPRALWHSSQKGYQLSHAYFKAAKLSTEKSESEENLEDVLEDVKKASETIRYNHPLRKCVDTILTKCPESLQQSARRGMNDYEDFTHNPTETPTEKSLVRLHTNVIWYSQAYTRTQTQWSHLMDKIVELEDMEANEASMRRHYVRTSGKYEGWFARCYTPTVEWYWKCLLRPIVLKVVAVCGMLMSFMVVWSEVLFFVKSPVLSLFALFVNEAQQNHNYFAIEVVCILTISYLCVCAYYTVFKIRFFNYYYLAAPHQTNEYSLIFCGMMLCRLTPPLCLNFLGLIHLDSHITSDKDLEETAYTQIMGHLDVLSFISNGFNIYFPILIVVLCVANYFHLVSRVLHCVGFQQFISDDDMTGELVEEGKQLVKRERRKRQRIQDGESRRRNWTERFGERSSSTQGTQPYRDDPHSNSAYTHDEDSTVGGSHPVLSSPDDRVGLLREAEPIDYTRASEDAAWGAARAGSSTRGSATRGGDYGSQRSYNNTGSINDSDYNEGGGGRYNSGAGKKSNRPPRGLFDDV